MLYFIRSAGNWLAERVPIRAVRVVTYNCQGREVSRLAAFFYAGASDEASQVRR